MSYFCGVKTLGLPWCSLPTSHSGNGAPPPYEAFRYGGVVSGLVVQCRSRDLMPPIQCAVVLY